MVASMSTKRDPCNSIFHHAKPLDQVLRRKFGGNCHETHDSMTILKVPVSFEDSDHDQQKRQTEMMDSG